MLLLLNLFGLVLAAALFVVQLVFIPLVFVSELVTNALKLVCELIEWPMRQYLDWMHRYTTARLLKGKPELEATATIGDPEPILSE